MSYKERQKQVAWTSPSGVAFNLKINDINTTFRHSGQLIDLFSEKGDMFFDAGITGRIIPLSIIFFGDNHDLDSDKFESALREIGEGTLQLPYDSPIKVNVLEAIRQYSLVNNVSTTTFKVVYHEIVQEAFPTVEGSAKSRLLSKVSRLTETLSSNFGNGLSIRTIFEKNAITSTIIDYVDTINDFAQPIIKEAQEAVAFATNVATSIKTNIELLSSDPFTIASQVAILVGVPSDTIDNFKSLMTYSEGLVNTITKDPFESDSLVTMRKRNDIYASALVGGGAVQSLCTGLLNSSYKTRTEAFEAAARLQAAYELYRDFLDNMQTQFESSQTLTGQYLQTGDLSVPLNDLIQQTAGQLVEISFGLKREYTFIVTKDTNMINIVSEYYPESFAFDEENNQTVTLDEFSDLNKLTNDELLLIPKGREIVVLI